MPARFSRRAALTALVAVFVAALALPACAPSPSQQQQQQQKQQARAPQALVGGTAVAPADGERIENATVLLDGDRIAAVGPSDAVDVPAGADRIDASGRYVLPGLIDAHVHFFQSGGLYTRPDALDLRFAKSYEQERTDIKARLPETLRRYLAGGITGVVDVGGPRWTLDVRETARQMAPRAPSVVVAGPLISSVARPALAGWEGAPPIRKVETPAEAREEVRRQAEAGVNLIKLWYIVGPQETPEAFRPVAEAAVAEADAAGLPVAAHATEQATARAAVDAGADVLVHSIFDQRVDDAFVRLLEENDVIYIPTIMVRERYGEVFAGAYAPTEAAERLAHPDVLASLDDLGNEVPLDRLPQRVRALQRRDLAAEAISPSRTAMQNLDTLHAAGVTIAAGTDAGNIGTPHGPSLVYEMQLMRRAGLSPMAVLRAATRGGARLIHRAGRDDARRLGRLEAGAPADLVVLRENPLDDLTHAATATHVIRGGRIFDTEALLPASDDEN
jgi:imidazolonepropionase-like amidohydrolase